MGRRHKRFSVEQRRNKITPGLIHPKRYKEEQTNRPSDLPRADPHILQNL
jgi:hypothetical protein